MQPNNNSLPDLVAGLHISKSLLTHIGYVVPMMD